MLKRDNPIVLLSRDLARSSGQETAHNVLTLENEQGVMTALPWPPTKVFRLLWIYA